MTGLTPRGDFSGELLDLGPEGESAWARLRRHLQWSDGLSLVLVYTDWTAGARELERRLRGLRQGPGATMEVLRPKEPDDLSQVLAQLIDPKRAQRLRLLECLAVEAEGRTAAPWRRALELFLLRANERRRLLMEGERGPLILVLGRAARSLFPATAPDLWTKRALVLDLEAPPRPGVQGPARAPEAHLSQPGAPGRRLVLAHREAERLRKKGRGGDELARVLLRAAEAASGEARYEDARADARAAVDEAEDVAIRARAFSVLARAEMELVDLEAALVHAHGGVHLHRDAAQAQGHAPQALRDLSISLNNLGKVLVARQDLDGAQQVFGESLELARQLYAATPGVWRASQDLRWILEQQIELADERGDGEVAGDLKTELAGLSSG